MSGRQIYTSMDSGVNWTPHASDRYWYSVASSADGTKLVTVEQPGQVYTSTDSGVTWTARESNRYWQSAASSADGTKLVAVVFGGQIYTSTDSGVNWTARETNRDWLSVASSADGTKLVAVVKNGQIYTSTDSGVNWTAWETNRYWQSVASSADGTKLVAGVTYGQIYTSADSGVNWTAHESNRTWFSVASSAEGTKLVAGEYNGQIYTSSAEAGLVFTPAANANGSPYTTFTFQVQDDGGTANGGVDLDQTPNTMTINVAAVNDPPVANAGSDQVVSAGSDCSVSITLNGTGSTDIDGDTLTYQWTGSFGTAAGSVPTVTLPLGIHTITLTVSDGQGASFTDTLLVTVNDTTQPLITSCAPAQNGSANASCQAAVPDFTSGFVASDCNGPLAVSQSPAAGTLVSLGATTVTLTVKDAANNASTCTSTFTVTDNTPPVIATCAPAQSAFANASCQAAVPNFTTGVVATECNGSVSVTQSPAAGTLVSLGATTVTLTVKDAANNASTCTTTFTVADNTPPVVTTCAPAQSAFANASCQAVVPNFTSTVMATDCNGPLSVTQSPAAGTLVSLGATSITLTVKDAANNASTCTTTFTVNDTQPPNIVSCAANRVLQSDVNLQASVPDLRGEVVSHDDCTAQAQLVVTQSPPPGTVFGLGDTPVTLTVRDEAGNSSTCTATLSVFQTPSGTNVVVQPVAAVGIVFENVISGGTTTVTSSTPGQQPGPPQGYRFGQPPILYDITTTATYSGRITVCFHYNEGDFQNEAKLKLFHFENGAWVNCTTLLDTVNNVLCGVVTSLSPFAIVEEVNEDVNYPPVITSVTGPLDPLAVNSTTTVQVNFTDANAVDNHKVTFAWGDGAVTGPLSASGGSAVASHQYIATGVYRVLVTVTDDGNASATGQFEFVVIYDSNGGFVTGGGWINSPAGSYVAAPLLTGRANFGFVSKYQKGANVPTGNTEFQFKVANLNFKSTVYQWLVVAGAKAQYKGSGTINGSGDFGFLLTCIDGQINGGGGTDKFRIKIWDKATSVSVYDNQLGDGDTSDPTTVLGGGSIVIHKE